MRLIRIEPDGSLSLIEYIDNKPITPYGILSHTWLLAGDEVTFKDMLESRGMEKKGYAKITFCAEQAQRDGLKFFWVDTCCIDKSQSSELNEAITSMYRWYQTAAKCYVYLRDVRCNIHSRSTVEEAIRRSRWFERGWTLQELLAPRVVEFYNEKGDFLGDRSSLCELIAQCTNIPPSALTGTTMSEFDVELRLSWMKGRRTTKEEDKAYALLGIFGVAMTAIYGEGYDNAFARLNREIQWSSDVSEKKIPRFQNPENKLQLLPAQKCNRFLDLGFPGCGTLDERVQIDDGLAAPYYIPLRWCKTPEDFYKFLKFKFRTEQLPGLSQVDRGHILTWEWNEQREISFDSWKFITTHKRALKVSFVMGSWIHPPRERCLRCRKPRSGGINTMVINECKSCRLAVRWVEPDYLEYEPEDHSLSLDKDVYRDYRANVQASMTKDHNGCTGVPNSGSSDETSTVAIPRIELVCRRLTMKFEPIFNIVYRYLYCRCALWRSTPSHFIPELTILRDYECPRHNTTGKRFRDYGDFALACDEDPYFDQFGGYKVFWALLHRRFPKIFEHLGGPSVMSELELLQCHIAYLQNEKEREAWLQDVVEGYWFEFVGYHKDRQLMFSPAAEEEYLRVETRRIELGIDKPSNKKGLGDDQIEQHQKDFSESTMAREIRDIISGCWTGEPHWKFGE